MAANRRPLVGVSLKAYFDRRRALHWAGQVATLAGENSWNADVEVFVLPDFLGIADFVRTLSGTGVAVGAQDVSAQGYGATTGDVPAARLAEEGCTLAAVGHAERRRGHAETDTIVTAKVERLVAAGLTPLLCVGEDERGVAAAERICRRQIAAATRACPPGQRVIVAYEPVWAIGAERPADAGYVAEVVTALRASFDGYEFLYGGSAGPGLLGELGGAVDGMFLGRFAHDPVALAAVVAEAAPRRAATNPS